jgi:hypothetical protein
MMKRIELAVQNLLMHKKWCMKNRKYPELDANFKKMCIEKFGPTRKLHGIMKFTKVKFIEHNNEDELEFD